MTDALVNQECLVVLHSGGIVRLYSLQHIITQVLARSFVVYFRQPLNCGIYLHQSGYVFAWFVCLFGKVTVKVINYF